MQDWQHSILEKFESARTLPRVRNEMGYLVQALGFDFWSYGQVNFQHFTRPSTLIMSNLPFAWQNLYQSQNYGAIDPVIKHGLHSSKSVIWDDTLYAKQPHILQNARSLGLQTGWSQSARDAQFNTVGVLSLVRREKSLSRSEVQEKQYRMHWLAHALHTKTTKLQNARIELSAREQEIMRWTADGKSANEIAVIMALKERSVTFHINNIIVRLGVQNKTAAAVRLAMSGLLY